MRFSFIFFAFLSAFFACVAASPVVLHRTPQFDSILSERALQRTKKGTFQLRQQAPKKVAVQAGAACAIRQSTKRPRDLEFAYLDRRGNLNDKELHYKIDPRKSNGGSYGDIHDVIDHPNMLAKKVNVKSGVGSKQSVIQLKEEAERVQAVGQFVDWGYKTNANCEKTFYIIMKRVPGIPFHKTEAYKATRGNVVARHVLVNHVAILVAQKMVQHHKKSGVLHVDTNGSNIMCIEHNGHITSVDLVDWGIAAPAENVDYHVALDYALYSLRPMRRV